MVLRFNVVTRRVEYRIPSGWRVEGGGQREEGVGWTEITDRLLNSLWSEMMQQKPVRVQDMQRVIESDFVPEYNPFRFYLENLPRWDGRSDFLLELSASVLVKGDVEEQLLFARYLKKWLVGMVAAWVDDTVVNNVILILIGEQGSYKTTWFNYLLPPPLRQYFYTKTNANRMGRDDLLTLAQYALVCCEELDSMRPSELNQLKAAVTMPSIDERAAYAHFHEHRPHIASFCGTGNNVQFLSDATGNRRWLPFEIESIDSPRDHPFDYPAIYAQAYALYRQGFRYWFSQAEIRRLAQYNCHFEMPHDEVELVDYYFSKPSGANRGEFMPTAIAQQIVSSLGTRVTTVSLGRAFSKLGFRSATLDNCRGYFVVRRTEEERRMRARSLAYETAQDNIRMTDDTDVF